MLTSKDVTRQTFTPTTMRHGYDVREVDDFLDRVIETLRFYEQGGRPSAHEQSTLAPVDSEGLAKQAARRLPGDPKP